MIQVYGICIYMLLKKELNYKLNILKYMEYLYTCFKIYFQTICDIIFLAKFFFLTKGLIFLAKFIEVFIKMELYN